VPLDPFVQRRRRGRQSPDRERAELLCAPDLAVEDFCISLAIE
jgi:hypothetical protein